MSLIIYHNPRCSKSRQTLALIEAAGQDVSIRRYLETPIHLSELNDLLDQLGFEDPRQLMRRNETVYKELKLKAVEDPERLKEAMLSNPKLIERPIVSDGKKAVLGRPPENVKALF